MVLFTNGRYEWLPGALLRYAALMASLAVSLALTFSRPLTILASTPLLLVIAISAAPEVGYGGQMVMLGLLAALASAVLAATGVLILPGGDRRTRVPLALVTAQAVVLAVGMELTGGFALLADVQNRAGALDAWSIQLESGRLSVPLLEGDRAFVVGASGDLLTVTLEPPALQSRVPLPRPDPAGYGLKAVAVGGVGASQPWLAEITHLDETRLRVTYPLAAERPMEGQRPAKPFWLVRAEVDLDQGRVASVAVAEGMVDAGWGTPRSVQSGTYTVTYGDYGKSLHVTGPGIDTRIWPRGTITWIATGERVVLAATDRGVLWIIGLPQ